MLSNSQFAAVHNSFKASAINEAAPIKKAFSDCSSARWMVCVSHCRDIVTWYEVVNGDVVKFYDDLPND